MRVLVVIAVCAPLGCPLPPAEPPPPPGATFTEVVGAIPADSSAATQSSGGFAVAELNGDGVLDLITTSGYGLANTLGQSAPVGDGVQELLLGAGDGSFPERLVLDGPATALAVAVAHFDGDGDIDVVMPTAGVRDNVFAGGEVHVWENVEGLLSPRATLAAVTGIPYAACPADFDRDGDLDLYISELYAMSHLYRNDGELSFTEVTADAGSVGHYQGWTNGCLAMDADDDGDLDLFTAYETLDEGIVLHRNNGLMQFSNVSVEALGAAANHMGNWMGFAAGDPDDDGDIDVFVTNMGFGAYTVGGSTVTTNPNGNPLHAMLENLGGGRFRDIAPDVRVVGLEPLPEPIQPYPDTVRGLAALEFGWTAWFFDYDNDADEDLLFFGSWAFSSRFQVVGTRERGANPGRLLENDGHGAYREVARAAGIEDLEADGTIANAWGSAVADLDGDGFLDVVVANQSFGEPGYRADLRVWRNNGNDNLGLDVELRGTLSAPHGFGARVELHTSAGRQVRQRVSASSISGPSITPLHFGMPKGVSAERLLVTWPSGRVSEHVAPLAGLVVIDEGAP